MQGEGSWSKETREGKDSTLPGCGPCRGKRWAVNARVLSQAQPKVTFYTVLCSFFQRKCEKRVLVIVYLFCDFKLSNLEHHSCCRANVCVSCKGSY